MNDAVPDDMANPAQQRTKPREHHVPEPLRRLSHRWRPHVAHLLRCYAAILFCESPVIGGVFLTLTMAVPNIGAAGLIAAGTAAVAASRLGLPAAVHKPAVYNSLLVGLSLGALYVLNVPLIVLIVLGSLLVLLITQVLADILARYTLPVLSLPFVLIAWTTWLAARSLGASFLPSAAPWFAGVSFGPWLDGFFTALGWFFFLPHALAGFILFAGVAWTSRYLAWLAVVGYAIGDLALRLFPQQPVSAPEVGFNFMLAAMAIGGIFAVPGVSSFALALLACALAALFTVVGLHLLAPYQLPVFTMPFVLATLTILAALARRDARAKPALVLHHPDLPQATYERTRLAQARLGQPGSIPLFAPFTGTWHVYQGFHGRHTHLPPWQHAFDFFIIDADRSFRAHGERLDDYHCFGAPVAAPANGYVHACRDDLPDNPPGEVDTRNNWGNYVLIRIITGHYVLLAHLRQGSIAVRAGDWVSAGQILAACGSSGRSPQPHLHFHVQVDPYLGSPTVAFHLVSVVTQQPGQEERFRLATRPEEMVRVTPAQSDERLRATLHLPVGRSFTYRFHDNTAAGVARRLHVELTLLGQFRLVSDGNASAAFEESDLLLAFYDRDAIADPFLDLWLLALGLTPLTLRANHWHDTVPARLLPLTPWQRLLLALHPLPPMATSRFTRTWDTEAQCWRQEGEHELVLLPGYVVRATTVAWLSPFLSCRHIRLHARHAHYEAVLEAVGLATDNGVPPYTEVTHLPESLSAAK